MVAVAAQQLALGALGLELGEPLLARPALGLAADRADFAALGRLYDVLPVEALEVWYNTSALSGTLF